LIGPALSCRVIKVNGELRPPSIPDLMDTRITDNTAGLAFIALIMGAMGIAFAPIFVRLSELDPTATAFYRLLLSLPLLAAWAAIDDRRLRKKNRKQGAGSRWLLVLPGLFFAGDLAFWHWSIMLTTVANATLFANFAPIYVTLGAVFIFHERVNRLFIVALILSICGAVILMGTSANLSRDHFIGDILGMITAVFYAAYILSVGRLRAHYTTGTIMFWSSLSAAAILLPVTLIAGESFRPETLYGWGILIALACFSHAGGQGLIAYALAHLSAAFSSVSLLVQPVAAAVLAWMIFGESLGWLQMSGGAMILASIYLARRANRLV